MKRKNPALCVALYVLAALLLVYTAIVAADCYSYVSNMISSGQLTFSGNIYEIISFFIESCANYLFFAITFLALGRILQINYNPTSASVNVIEDENDSANWYDGK